MQQITKNNGSKAFSKLRNFLWPIYNHELKKLVPMFALFFLITFIYNLLRCMKVSIIVTAEGSGAEVVPYLKIGAVLPAAVLLTYIFTKLNNKFNREKVFYSMLFGFLAYFALFMLILYPCRNPLELNGLADFIQANILTSEGFHGLVAIIRHWNLALFYVVCEMWSAIMLSMLFWGFANEVTKVNEAKRFYAIFALGANSSGIFTGFFSKSLNSISLFNVSLYDSNSQWIFYQMAFVLILGFVIFAIFYYLERYVFMDNKEHHLLIAEKPKLSLTECFSYLKSSKYLLCIVIIVVAYNIVFNLADVMWTYKINEVYKDSRAVNNYMNLITQLTGVAAVISAFLISGNVVRAYGWTVAALITPIVWGLTSIGFFGGLLLEKTVIFDMLYTFVGNPANLVLLIGSIQVCLGRGCKYTVFDETKELAFIPLARTNQRKAKAVVDGIASRFGKSGGSMIYIVLLMIVGDIALTIPYISIIIFIAIGLWMVAVFTLGSMVKNSIDNEEADHKEHKTEDYNEEKARIKVKQRETVIIGIA